MTLLRTLAGFTLLVASGCAPPPEPWDGPKLTRPRDQLTVEQLLGQDTPPLLDTSFLARPAWATDAVEPFAGATMLDATTLTMDVPATRALYPGEDRFPTVTLAWVAHEGQLVPRERGLIRTDEASHWDVLVGTGAVWREAEDGDWTRASFPLDLVDRYFNQVRNCVATFAYQADQVTGTYVQCSQETADLNDEQLGDLRALVPATHAPASPADFQDDLAAHALAQASRIPTCPLRDWDADGALAEVFDEAVWTHASTSVGAVFDDGTLYVHPAQTRHGPHPYPAEMHHGVYSVTKSLAAAVAMFYVAQRYGAEVFDERVTDHVPALAERPEWQGVTLSHALNMVTGTQGGEDADQLFEPLVLADTRAQAIANIARLGDAPEAPGEAFRYATTNTFVLSSALQHLVEQREGEGVYYWDLVQRDVLAPIGAEDFDLLLTRDPNTADRIPYLGFGARPTLDQAARVAALIANEGEHEGQQLLHRGKIREALGRTDRAGFPIDGQRSYRHAFWSQTVRSGRCRAEVAYMQGHGGNHVLLLPSGVIVFRFTDEHDEDITSLVKGAEGVRSSCE
ncbi:MAG: beta-lactamase family protein [Alphaproteobacteria bacterium]|nr:beta-lactamase family protein [Alphaproteobacteria bacterium]MCB9791090.1 beta-lactamase family protein [Alphaproteobacteria bacterium]